MMAYADRSDAELIREIRKGDDTAFKELYMRYYKRINNYLYNMGIRRENILDISQEIFLALYAGLPSYKEQMRFHSYLFRIAHNVCVSHIRKAAKNNLQQSIDAADDDGHEPGLSDSRYVPQSVIANSLIEEKIDAFMRGLPLRERNCLTLKIFNEMSAPHIARAVGIPERTTRRVIKRSLEKLGAFLESLDIRREYYDNN